MENFLSESFITRANRLGSNRVPFFFLIDFELKEPVICPLSQAAAHQIYYNVRGVSNASHLHDQLPTPLAELSPCPVSRDVYSRAFNHVMRHLKGGNTYLLNLTFPTRLNTSLSLTSVFAHSPAYYKLLYKNRFVLFSPECFIRIANNHIHSFPMKGTIDASIAHAKEKILDDRKEQYEHNTIVDLIRNDLSMVSQNVKVPRFRYIDKVKASQRHLYQVSSEVQGDLPIDWPGRLGSILAALLPAGSVSGAPKSQTLKIIRESEHQPRGFFTGVFGIFDGNMLDSAVNIRYIENTPEGFFFRSGGGITALSQMEEEYDEMIKKVYIPVA